MSEQRTGKVTAEIFGQVILRRLGARDPGVVVGPAYGVDVGVVRVAPGTVMALTSDPVFIVPAYGWARAAWFAVHILASDAATSGLPLTRAGRIPRRGLGETARNRLMSEWAQA